MLDLRRSMAAVLALTMATPLLAKPTPAAPAKGKPAASASSAPSQPPAPPPPPSTPEEAEARKHFEIGLKLYKEKAYEAALTEFEQSYKIVPRPSALRNVAQCQRDLKRFAEAYAAYEKLLSVHGAQLAPKESEAVKKAMKDIEQITGAVALEVSEAGATVFLDGREIGTTPLVGPVRVDVGPHQIRVVKAGFETVEQSVKVVAQQSLSVAIKLVKDVKTGKLTVKEKSGAKVNVVVDDVDRGPAPWTGELSPGSHVVELKGDTLISARKTIEIVAKTEQELVLEATALRGRLRVETTGAKGKIFVDDKEVGTGSWEDDLPPGPHRVKVVAAGYQPVERTVQVEHGKTWVEAVTLVAVPTPAPPLPPTAPVADPFRGLYGRFGLFGAFSASGAGEEIRPTCSDTAPCDATSPMGAGVNLHVGHSFGVVGVEFVGAFLADYHQTKRSFNGPPPPTRNDLAGNTTRTETYDFLSFAGFAGVGARVTSKDDAVRFTFGGALGGVYRHVNFKRTTLDDGWKPPAVGDFAPGLVFDAGLLLGSTPGFKMTVGAIAWIDFAGSLETEGAPGGTRPATTQFLGEIRGLRLESPPQLVRSGTQIYFGPTLGFQFGR